MSFLLRPPTPIATSDTPGLFKPGANLVLNATTGAFDVDARTPVPATGAVPSGEAFPCATGAYTYTIEQIAARVVSIIGAGSGGTTPAPSPAPASGFPLTFAGAAGAPTGAQALTPLGSANLAGVALDGNGGIIGPSAQYQSGVFQAAGVVADGQHVDFTFAPSSNGERSMNIVLRATADGTTGYFGTFIGGLVVFYKRVSGVDTEIGRFDRTPVVNGATSVGFSFAGNTFTVRINGANTDKVFTDGSITAPGRVGFGSGLTGSNPVISRVDVGP